MECPRCARVFGVKNKTPLLLIKCGHTLCQGCAYVLFRSGSIVCPVCEEISSIEAVSQLPKNMALLSMSNTSSLSVNTEKQEEAKCSIHGKKIEGYCKDDHKLLCINCILFDGHKSHEISPVTTASCEVRKFMEMSCESMKETESRLRFLLAELTQLGNSAQETAVIKRAQISEIFHSIKKIVEERQNTLIEQVEFLLEKEQEIIEERKRRAEEQLRAIASCRSEQELCKHKSDCEVLGRFKDVKSKFAEASQDVTNYFQANHFPEISRESEMQNIARIISLEGSPKKSPTFAAPTTSSASKEEAKRPITALPTKATISSAQKKKPEIKKNTHNIFSPKTIDKKTIPRFFK